MRIMLYRTLENMIEGVVITFMDVTVSRTLEAKLRETQAGLHKQIIEQGLKLEQRGHLEKDALQSIGRRRTAPPGGSAVKRDAEDSALASRSSENDA